MLKEGLRESAPEILHTHSRMFTNIFLGAALFLIAVCAFTHRNSLYFRICHLYWQETSAKVQFLSQMVILNSVWIAAFDVYHNIVAMNDRRARIIPY